MNSEHVKLFLRNRLTPPVEIFKDQFAYGHREILLDYAGLSTDTILLGKLQHGSTPLEYLLNFNSPKFHGKRSPFWVFTKNMEVKARCGGYKNVQAIGAPWLYLQHLLKDRINEDHSVSKKFLIMPEHSTQNYIDLSSKDIKRKRAEFFRDLFGVSNSTVCLHWNDFLDLETRSSFLELGFEVTCLGTGYNSTPWSSGGDRIKFLPNLYQLLKTHTHWIGESFNSSMFYAMSMGLQIGIFPDNPHYFKMGTAGYSVQDNSFETLHNLYYTELSDAMKTSFNNFTKDGVHEEIWKAYLGSSNVLKPEELAATLKYEIGALVQQTEIPWRSLSN